MARAMTNSRNSAQKTPWLMIAGLMLLSTAGSAGGVYYLMEKRGVASPQGTPQVQAPSATPIYVAVSPFTVNLQTDPNDQRLLYVGLSLKVSDERSQEYLVQHMPQLRSRLLTMMAAQKAETLLNPQGKDQLAAEILKSFSIPLGTDQTAIAVTDVLYTDFIVQ